MAKYDYENATHTNADSERGICVCAAMCMVCLDSFGSNILRFDKVCLITCDVFCPSPWCTQGDVCK